MEALKWTWSFLKKSKYLYFGSIFLIIMSTSFGLTYPYLIGNVISYIENFNGDFTPIYKILIFMLAFIILKTLTRYAFLMLLEFSSQSAIYRIRMKVYSHLQKLDATYFDETRTGSIMTRMAGDMENVRHFIAWVTYMALENIISFFAALTIILVINIKLSALLLLYLPVIAFLIIRLRKNITPAFRNIWDCYARLSSTVEENISANRVVKAFANEEFEIEKFSKHNDEFREIHVNLAKVSRKYNPSIEFVAGLMYTTNLCVGGIMVLYNLLPLSDLVAVNLYLWLIIQPVCMSGHLANEFQKFFVCSKNIMEILNYRPKITSSATINQEAKATSEIEFRNVSFSYKNEPTIKDVSFKIRSGQKLAIVGPTGAGKSTLINLLSRFYEPNEGEILIDGINIKDIPLKSLRRNIASAMQDIFLFSDTIENNIAYGVPDAEPDAVVSVAKLARAHDFILKFKDGYDTIVGERGVGLSGGQKQRIALARALLKNSDILILDDTTSSIDAETEMDINRTLKSYYQDKTVFIIAHKIASVKDADIILVLENGTIKERGTHEELIKSEGYYKDVFKNQYGDFDEKLVASAV